MTDRGTLSSRKVTRLPNWGNNHAQHLQNMSTVAPTWQVLPECLVSFLYTCTLVCPHRPHLAAQDDTMSHVHMGDEPTHPRYARSSLRSHTISLKAHRLPTPTPSKLATSCPRLIPVQVSMRTRRGMSPLAPKHWLNEILWEEEGYRVTVAACFVGSQLFSL